MSPSTPLALTNAQGRHIVLALQGLCAPHHKALGEGGLPTLLDQLGFVQVDSIQWVERAQHMTLQARSQTYRPHDLQRLIERDRLAFEGWTHDASIIPSQFYCYWRHRFRRNQARVQRNFERWQGPGFADHVDALLDRVRETGPIRARDLEKPKNVTLAMWQWHDGKAALEFLWNTGQLCIAGRDGFQKIYDLPERTLLPRDLERQVSESAFIDWACRSALLRLGFGTAGDISRYWDLVTIAEATHWLEQQGDSTFVPVTVADVTGGKSRTMVARADIEEVLAASPPPPDRMRALSPFDPVIRNRKRLSWLFGFDYRIEIYVPAAKRVWGYYVFPLLEGDRLVGRIDMRADRKADTLEVRRVWWEKSVRPGTGRMNRLAGELQRQARFAGLGSVTWLPGAQD